MKQSDNDHIRALLALYNDKISGLQIEVENPEDDNEIDKEDEDLVEEEAMVLESMFDSAFKVGPKLQFSTSNVVNKIDVCREIATYELLIKNVYTDGFKVSESCPIVLLSADSWTSEQSRKFKKLWQRH